LRFSSVAANAAQEMKVRARAVSFMIFKQF